MPERGRVVGRRPLLDLTLFAAAQTEAHPRKRPRRTIGSRLPVPVSPSYLCHVRQPPVCDIVCQFRAGADSIVGGEATAR